MKKRTIARISGSILLVLILYFAAILASARIGFGTCAPRAGGVGIGLARRIGRVPPGREARRRIGSRCRLRSLHSGRFGVVVSRDALRHGAGGEPGRPFLDLRRRTGGPPVRTAGH